MSETMENNQQKNGNQWQRRKKMTLAAATFAALGLSYGGWYLVWGQYHESTDDAYVNANMVYVTAQVGGIVTSLGSDDNLPVHAGQTLVKLDSADATSNLASAAAQLGETVRQVRSQFLAADAAKALVAQRSSELLKARGDLQRRSALSGGEVISAEELAHVRDTVSSDANALEVAQKQLEQAEAAVHGSSLLNHPSVKKAREAYVQAALAAQRNAIPAPVDGFVARRSVQVGQHISAGDQLLAVVPLQSAWVDANFKESQLSNLRIGQAVTIEADVYGGKIVYHGKINSLSAGAGGAFSLLPPQNATGNWIKVVQRLPVRIALDPAELKAHPLRVGLSATVDVDTHQRDQQEAVAQPLPGAALSTSVFETQLKLAGQQADSMIAHEAGSL